MVREVTAMVTGRRFARESFYAPEGLPEQVSPPSPALA